MLCKVLSGHELGDVVHQKFVKVGAPHLNEGRHIRARVNPGPYLVVGTLPEHVEIVSPEKRIVSDAETDAGASHIEAVQCVTPNCTIVLRRLASVSLYLGHLALSPSSCEVEGLVGLAGPPLDVGVATEIPARRDLSHAASS